jgi:hypothetical protein
MHSWSEIAFCRRSRCVSCTLAAHVRYRCLQRFKPGPDALGKYFLDWVKFVLADLSHHWEDEVVTFLVSTYVSALQ